MLSLGDRQTIARNDHDPSGRFEQHGHFLGRCLFDASLVHFVGIGLLDVGGGDRTHEDVDQ